MATCLVKMQSLLSRAHAERCPNYMPPPSRPTDKELGYIYGRSGCRSCRVAVSVDNQPSSGLLVFCFSRYSSIFFPCFGYDHKTACWKIGFFLPLDRLPSRVVELHLSEAAGHEAPADIFCIMLITRISFLFNLMKWMQYWKILVKELVIGCSVHRGLLGLPVCPHKLSFFVFIYLFVLLLRFLKIYLSSEWHRVKKSHYYATTLKRY